ncbi:MAG: hypothetical protein ACLR8Y_13040 [Alistipes indistinctus]
MNKFSRISVVVENEDGFEKTPIPEDQTVPVYQKEIEGFIPGRRCPDDPG